MTTQLEGRTTVPKELIYDRVALATSYTELLGLLKADSLPPAIRFFYSSRLNSKEKDSPLSLPKAFGLNTTLLHLTFYKWEVNDIRVSKAFRAAFRSENLRFFKFWDCKNRSHVGLLKFMCEGLQLRATNFQLELSDCSSEVVKPIICASYSKCFSLNINYMDCTRLEMPLKNLFKRNLCYITLCNVKGLKEILFLELGRCVSELPNLTKLNFGGTFVPTAALKRLFGSMKKILASGRVNAFENLDLGTTEVGEKLSYLYFKLFSSDLIEKFGLLVKGDVSTTVVKSITSTVANTKKLKRLGIGRNISSRTQFKGFTLKLNGTWVRNTI